MLDPLRRRRLSLYALSLLVGLGTASWVTRTPAVRDAVDASTADMGLVLLGLSLGSVAGVTTAGRLVRRTGTRPVVVLGTALVLTGIAVVGVATAAGTGAGVFAGLVLFGLGGGTGEIALNVEAAALERVGGRQVLPRLHGSYSLGTVVGALAGLGLTSIDFPVVGHLLLAAAALAALAAWALPGVPAGTGREAPATRGPGRAPERRPGLWRDGRLVLIGVVVLAMAFAEGSATDWLPLLMVDGHGATATQGSLVYAGFAATMTLGRFAGGSLVDRFGRGAALRVSAVVAAAGVLGVALIPHPVAAAVAVVLWGLGASLGFPVAISAAGDDPERATERVSAVATSGYVAFLVGPPLLGFLGEHVGLRPAMLAVVALLAVAAVAAGGIGRAPARPGRPARPADEPGERVAS